MKLYNLFLSIILRIIPGKILFTSFIIIFSFIFQNKSFAGTVTSNGTSGGDWSIGTTWAGGIPPASGDDVVIADGDVVSVDVTASCNSLTIQADATGWDFTTFSINSAKTLTVNNNIDFTMLNGASVSFQMSGPGLSQLIIKGNFTNYASGGTVTFALDPASRVRYSSASLQTVIAANYGALAASGGNRIFSSTGTIGITGVFTPAATYTVTGSTIDFNGTGAQTIPVFNYNNLTISGARTTYSVTLTVAGGSIGVSGAFSPTATFSSGGYILNGSTITYNSSSPQTIAAFNYNNLTSSSTGGRTLAAAGTVGIAGAFTKGTNTYTTTGSTVDFNGSAGQVVPALNYNNLTASNTTTIAFPNGGTVSIAGTFTPGTAAYTVTGNTVDFNGTVGQTIPAFNYNNLTASNTSSIILAAAGTVGVAGTFTPGTAAYTATGSTVNYSGAGQNVPALPGAVNYNNITVSGSGTKTLTGNSGITGTLTVSAGTFDINTKTFTLISNASGTANIATITGSGGAGEPNISGSITMQRWAPGSPNGNDWRFLSSAVSGATIGSWKDNFAMTGFTGATCEPSNCIGGCAATCTWVSTYTYDPAIAGGVMDNGWVAATDTGNSISNGQGFDVYLGPTPVTFDVHGPPNKFTQPLTVNYTNTGNPTQDGWNLVPNPYPCAIDWKSASWTKTNMNNAIYIYNSSGSNGGYASFVPGTPDVSVNGGSQFIASQQAFFVQATGAPTLTATEDVKASAQTPTFQRLSNSPNTSQYPMAFSDFPVPLNTNNIANSIRLNSHGNGHNDEIFIRFTQGATNVFDGQYDAWKLANPDSTDQNFSSLDANNRDLSINSFPELTSDVSIPIRLTMPPLKSGHYTYNYSISRDSILMLPASSCLYLEDKATSNMINLKTTVTYTFSISDTTVAPRFILHVYAPMTKKGVNVTCAGTNNGIAIAKGIGAGPWNYEWKNSSGIVVKPSHSSLTADTLFSCAAGTYSVSVDGAFCGTVTDTIVIHAPSVLSNNLTKENISCFGTNNGTASVVPLGGTPSYSYLWGDNQTTSVISNLSQGDYSVTTTDANGCTATSSFTVTQPTALTNSVVQTNVSCFGENSGTAAVTTSGGTPSYTYSWSDGQSDAAATSLLSGNYSILVTDGNGCTKTSSVTITQPSAALTVSISVNPAQCNVSNGVASANVSGGTSGYSFLWDNNETTASLTGLSAGSYSVIITDANGCSANNVANVSNIGGVTASIASTTSAGCHGGNDGLATAGTSGGTPAITYSWNTSPVQTTISATGLSAGNYIVTVTDGIGCISIASASVDEPAALSISPSHTNVSCFGGSNGTATLTGTGGTPSYSYLWSNGGTESSASNLSLGTYSVTTTDAHGCTLSSVIDITQPDFPLSVTSYNTAISCNGYNNATLEFTAAGGTPTYSYLWNNNLTSSSGSHLGFGSYSVTITDAHGCTKDTAVTLTEPSPLTYSVSLTNVSCFGGNNGTSTVSASGGTPTYSYLWSNGQASPAVTNLSAGNYSVKITDANGCSTSAAVSISQPTSMITAGFTASTYTIDLATGNSISFANNSIGASFYEWNFGDTTAINNAVNPTHSYTHIGTYTVTLTASDGNCSDMIYKTIVVVNSDPLAVSNLVSSSSVNVIYDNGTVYLQFSLDKKTQVNITIYNLIGEKISSQNNLQIKNEKIKLDLHNPSAGVYIAVSETPYGNISKKIVIPADR